MNHIVALIQDLGFEVNLAFISTLALFLILYFILIGVVFQIKKELFKVNENLKAMINLFPEKEVKEVKKIKKLMLENEDLEKLKNIGVGVE